MNMNSASILCDGCGLPASPGHIAARLARLELATRFRPIHIDTLFVALQPTPRLEDDFYRPPDSRNFFDSFLSAVNILPEARTPGREGNGREADISRLLEFQRKGYYLAYLSECPLPAQENANMARASIARLAPTLIKRIRFNYKPKHIAVLGTQLGPLIEIFREAGISPVLDFKQAAAPKSPSASFTWGGS
jgi:hypothetical protein